MEPLHITESDLARDLHAILKQVEAGHEVIVERDLHPVAILRPAEAQSRKISDCLALLSPDSTATIDPEFAHDVEHVILSHGEPLEPPNWD